MYTIYIKQSSIRLEAHPKTAEISAVEGYPVADDVHQQPSTRKISAHQSSQGFEKKLSTLGAEALCLEVIKEIQCLLESPDPIHKVFITQRPKQVLKELKNAITYLKAAGGLVKNEKTEYLMIYRLGYWDLPKGKLETNESAPDCAIREIEEECGVRVKVIKKEIPSTYHVYRIGEQMVLKRTYWFLMKADSCTPVAQIEEGITDVRWIHRAGLSALEELTYLSIRDVLSSIPDYNSGLEDNL